MFFGRKPSYRKFSYKPRYYNPEKEKKLKRRMRIKSKTRRGSVPGFIWLVALLAFGLYLYLSL